MIDATIGPSLESLRARKAEVLRIAAARGARNVHVFGSVARGDSDAGSDIDFLVEMEPGRNVLDLSELILDLEELFGRRVDVVDLRRTPPTSAVVKRIRQEAVPL
jgi:predicted nucleotidyltransferase